MFYFNLIKAFNNICLSLSDLFRKIKDFISFLSQSIGISLDNSRKICYNQIFGHTIHSTTITDSVYINF